MTLAKFPIVLNYAMYFVANLCAPLAKKTGLRCSEPPVSRRSLPRDVEMGTVFAHSNSPPLQ